MNRFLKSVLILGLAVTAHARAADGGGGTNAPGAMAGIEGKVIVAATGEPLPGVKLRWQVADELHDPVVSGADGAFRLKDIAPGKGWVVAEFPGEPVADWVAEDVPVTLKPGETRGGVLVRALRGGVAEISVLSQIDRKPMTNMEITLTSQLSRLAASARTGADGVARVRLLPDIWRIAANQAVQSGGLAMIQVATSQTNRVEISAEAGSKVAGTVHNPDGSSAVGAQISFAGLRANVSGIKTDTNGRYVITWSSIVRAVGMWGGINLIGGQNVMTVRSADGNLALLHAFDQNTTNLDLTLQPSVTISAMVVDNLGRPVTNAIANVYALQNASSIFVPGINPAGSDARGQVDFSGLPMADGYYLVVSAKGYNSGNAQMQSPRAPTNHLEFPPIVLPIADQVLRGKVVDLEGKPVPQVSVQAYAFTNVSRPSPSQPDEWIVTPFMGPYQGSAQTDTEGRFFFDAVCAGLIQLNFNYQGSSFTLQTIAGTTNILLRLNESNVNVRSAASPRPATVPVVTIAGTVRDPSGAPAVGVRLRLYGDFANQQEVTTDSRGFYSLKWREQNPANPPSRLLVARDIGRNLVASHDINERTTNVDLSLQPGLTLSVKVQDANGQPLPSATASLALTNWDLSRTPERADEQGLIEIKALLQGRAYSATIAARGYNVARIRVPAEETETTRFEFPEVVLRAADRTLAGTVFGPDNKPFPRANVGLSGIGQSSISVGTDADGHFAFFALVEGVVRLSASARFDNDYLRAEVRAHSDDTNVVIRFTNNPAEGPRPAVVANSAMVTNAGRILDPPGAPVSGALMSIAPSFGNRIEGRSDAGGKFSVVWQARNAGGANLKHFIYVRDEGRNLAVSQDADETVTNLELRLQPGLTLSVKAQDVNGKPIPAATASLAIREGTSAFDFNQITGRADAQGLIEIKALPPGRPYTVTITAPGFSITNLQAQAADTQTTRFELPPAVLKAADLRIYGHVVTPDGKPAPEARMLLNGDGQKPANTTADSRGHFAFYSLAAGPVRLIANIEADDGRSFGGGIIAQAGDSNVLIWLGVDGINNPDLQILTTSGKVLDTSGAPVAGAGLSILPGFGASLEVKSDAGGNYSITWKNQNRTKAGVRNSFPATPYVLVAHDARHESFAAVELDGLATNVDLRLLPGFTLTGTVRATNGQPVTNAVVALVLDPPNDGRSFVNPLQTTNAGAQGSFTFSGLPQEARYCLRVSAAGYGSNSTLVSAADTRTTQLQLPAIVLKAANRQLAGRVLGLDQQPAPAAQVTMHGEGQPGFKTVSSDTNGLFVIQEICDGLVDVRAVLSSRTNNPRSLVGAVQAHGGDTNIVVQLGMTNGVPVVGTAGVMRVTTNRPPVPAPLGP